MFRTVAPLCIFFMISSFATAADLARAQQIVEERCYLCHGKDGQGSSAIYPRLAGQNPIYIARQLADFKAGLRKGTMNEMAADLTEQEMIALGEYFGAKLPEGHRVRDKELSAVGLYIFKRGNKFSGVAACASCHGIDGKGSLQLPRLAGQHKRYLKIQLQEFNERTRSNPVMASIASKLTELEIEAVTTYISCMGTEAQTSVSR